MEATMIICDYAQVNNGKLYMVGGAGNLLPTPSADAPHPVNAWAAILITVPWHAHNQGHKMIITLRDADGVKVPIAQSPAGVDVPEEQLGSVVGQFNAGRSPVMEPGDESLMPLAVPLQIPVPKLGSYRLTLEIDGSEIASARFRVVFPAQLGMAR